MIRLIWKSWLRHKERFVLLLIGVLVMSSGLSYLFGLTENNKGIVVENLQKKWKSAYDIVVTPPNSIQFNGDLLEPNFLNSISGGISKEQYSKIKQIDGVEVAAPISVLGYTTLGVTYLNEFSMKEPGIYRIHGQTTINNGLKEKTIKDLNYYAAVGSTVPKSTLGLMTDYNGFVKVTDYKLLVGIDPEQEAKLVGLDKAIEPYGNSRYFSKKDEVLKSGETKFQIPVLINSKSPNHSSHHYELEKLDIAFSNEEEQRNALRKITEKGGREYLNKVETSEIIDTFQLEGSEVEKAFFSSVSGVNPKTGKEVQTKSNIQIAGTQLIYQPTKVPNSETESAFPKRWEHAFEIHSKPLTTHKLYKDISPNSGYRDLKLVETNIEFTKEEAERHKSSGIPYLPVIEYNVVGFYDPMSIKVTPDPINDLPMQTYRPSTADLVLDENGTPLNPPGKVNGSSNPAGLLTNAPTILTTLEAAESIMYGNSISAIRIKVGGIETFGTESQAKLEKIKNAIEDETGLDATITRGSSPQPTITKIVDNGNVLGWMEQPWINIGAATTIFRETTMGYSSVILALLLVGIVYVFATNIVSFYTRRKEYSTLLALGWKRFQLSKLIVLESLMLWVAVILTSIIIEVILFVQNGHFIWSKIALIGLSTLLIYFVGALIPIWLSTRISPFSGMRQGEITVKGSRFVSGSSLFGIAVNQFIGRFSRNILSIFAIALPTTLLSFYIFITSHLDGVLHTSWLGEFVAVQINGTHYIMMTIALIIGILTTAEIMWQNISDRKPEIAVLKSIGWKNTTVRWLILMEGAFIGVVAGLLGLLFSLTYIGLVYGIFPWDSLRLLSLIIFIPITAGIIGSLVPSENAVQIHPYQLLKSS